ncbi:hypothetical protein TBC1_11630 [Lentimicrobium saccharophilum]|uniref:Uncharacterized protein n=1 Tax=Lentimicrobium saccharophilum TaxID=1678841 RepID=A0A0S7BYV2_9BACT|nr:hypothetical protein TBC1_11630 [Lentimicrobium saccharophilum]
MSDSQNNNDTFTKLKNRLTSRNIQKNIAGLILGALGGFLYYRLVGCNSGGCAITSNPYISILWGAAMGYLLADIFKIREKTKAEDPAEKNS